METKREVGSCNSASTVCTVHVLSEIATGGRKGGTARGREEGRDGKREGGREGRQEGGRRREEVCSNAKLAHFGNHFLPILTCQLSPNWQKQYSYSVW